MEGTVLWFDRFKRGFGFIEGEDGSDYFAHFRNIDFGKPGHKHLEPGSRVTFEPGEAPDGSRRKVALHIMPLAAPADAPSETAPSTSSKGGAA